MMNLIFSTNISQDLGHAEKNSRDDRHQPQDFSGEENIGQERQVNNIEKPSRVAEKRRADEVEPDVPVMGDTSNCDHDEPGNCGDYRLIHTLSLLVPQY